MYLKTLAPRARRSAAFALLEARATCQHLKVDKRDLYLVAMALATRNAKECLSESNLYGATQNDAAAWALGCTAEDLTEG